VDITIRNTDSHHPRREEEINEQGRNKKVARLTGGGALETNASDGQMTSRLMNQANEHDWRQGHVVKDRELRSDIPVLAVTVK
jgi:hypothetical protein